MNTNTTLIPGLGAENMKLRTRHESEDTQVYVPSVRILVIIIIVGVLGTRVRPFSYASTSIEYPTMIAAEPGISGVFRHDDRPRLSQPRTHELRHDAVSHIRGVDRLPLPARACPEIALSFVIVRVKQTAVKSVVCRSIVDEHELHSSLRKNPISASREPIDQMICLDRQGSSQVGTFVGRRLASAICVRCRNRKTAALTYSEWLNA